MTTIKLKNGSGAPTAGDLVQGEPALDLTNKRLYTEDSGGTVIEVGTNPTSLTTGTLTTTGSVGIGESSPVAALHVKTSTNTPLLLESTIASGGYAEFKLGASGATIGYLGSAGGIVTSGAVADLAVRSQANLTFATGGSTERMRIDSSGNVGINSSTPSSYFSPQLVVHSSSNLGGITIRSNATTDTNYLVFADGTSGNERYRGYVSYDHNVDTMKLATGASPAITIDSSQNVGIGTSSPSTMLHLGGTAPGDSIIRQDSTVSGTNWEIGEREAGKWQIFEDDSDSIVATFMSSGNVGIGVTSTFGKLSINSNGAPATSGNMTTGLTVHNSTTGTAINIGTNDGGAYNYIQSAYVNSAGTGRNLAFFAGATRAVDIDASGNLLVGTTSTSASVAGGRIFSTGRLVTSVNSEGHYFRRNTTDGAIVEFAKDGSTVGSIGSRSGNLFTTYTSNGYGLTGTATSNAVIPSLNGSTSDNAVDLGAGAVRFDDIYATNGTIQTSDRNEKQDIETLSDAEQRVAVAAKGLLRKFRWINSVEENGDDARIHFGIIAQDLQDAFTAEGLDAGRYAMFISTTWTDEETGEERTRMGVRYSELLAFIIAAI